MFITLEFDGILADLQKACHKAHVLAATDAGWSRMTLEPFWRATRTKGDKAVYLPGASPLKVKKYQEAYERIVEGNDCLAKLAVRRGLAEPMRRLAHHARVAVVSAGSNAAARRSALEHAGWSDTPTELHMLDPDPRNRAPQLEEWAQGDRRSLLLGSSDTVIRTAATTDFLAVGITCGTCSGKRLLQAGAALLFHDLQEFTDCLVTGGKELLEAGLMPTIED